MKINFSRQNIYLLVMTMFLLVFVLVFSFAVLIPNGKEYRVKRVELKKENIGLKQLSNFSIEKEVILQKLQSDNLHVIKAFGTEFNAQRFEKQHKLFFSSLSIIKMNKAEEEEGFSVYEVNTTSEISSPKSFYNFLDAVNKSDWIIAVNFPINFKRDGEMISSSFTMKVYNNKESNATE
ncbi:hypothetical protein [Sulfurimonas sp.]|uniref:hypothetical protein n=1 Tax=Sulfurimonas sp. TaxID=2022749 RepID=UPI0025FBACF8|nr:hypothetical protein [Sulfurimonas sp.]MCK9473793.1 hypothetical protein [Sulfurimonas sp.]MDD3505448.1 hypothetical protein [Sulfurimonas sp.]